MSTVFTSSPLEFVTSSVIILSPFSVACMYISLELSTGAWINHPGLFLVQQSWIVFSSSPGAGPYETPPTQFMATVQVLFR